jgi:diacylglycerol kinase (ATP)
MQGKSILIIVNPVAGGGTDLEMIDDWAADRSHACVRHTREAEDGVRWAREALESGTLLVVAAGGDGTIRQVAGGLLGCPAKPAERNPRATEDPTLPALGLLPLGTGNDLARSLDVPLALPEALELLDRGTRRWMDAVLLTLDGSPAAFYLNALTGGFSGDLHGTLDGSRTQYRALNLIVGNGSSAGGGLPVALGADPFDGLLEVVIFLDAPALELSGLAARLLSGDNGAHPAVVRLQGHSVRVRTGRVVLPVSIDGEPGKATDLGFRVRPRVIPVMVPPPPARGRLG